MRFCGWSPRGAGLRTSICKRGCLQFRTLVTIRLKLSGRTNLNISQPHEKWPISTLVSNLFLANFFCLGYSDFGIGIPVISQVGISPSQLLQQGLTLLNDYFTIMHQDLASALLSCTAGNPSGNEFANLVTEISVFQIFRVSGFLELGYRLEVHS